MSDELLRKARAVVASEKARTFVGGAAAGALLYVLASKGPSGALRSLIGSVLATARALPGVGSLVAAAEAGAMQSLVDELAPLDPTARNVMDAAGVGASDLLSEIKSSMSKDVQAAGFLQGKAFAGIYHHPLGELTDLQCSVMAECINTNLLYPGVFRTCRKMEAEVVAMMVGMLKGNLGLDEAPSTGAADPAPDACGLLSTGGTESILLATKAYREAAFAARGGPFAAEVVACITCHPALDKACEYLGLKLHKLPADPATQALSASAAASAINGNTIFVYASAPSFPHGVVDPVPELAALCASKRIGLHVDNCLGGVLLSYAHALQSRGAAASSSASGAGAGAGAGAAASAPSPLARIPDFDFRVPGVTSVSIDVHKYGFAPKGASVVAFRDSSLRRHCYTTVTDWPGGLYATPTVTGSRSGASAAVAWATLRYMGGKRYAEMASLTQGLLARLVAEVSTMPHLEVVGRPAASIFAFTAARGAPFSPYSLAARMEARGHHLNSMQDPAALALVVTERFAENIDAWLADLRACVAEAVASPKDAAFEGKGSAGIYGMSAVLPASELGRILQSYCDILYMVRPAPGAPASAAAKA